MPELESADRELWTGIEDADAFQENANKRIKALEDVDANEIQVAAMMKQAFQGAIDAHFHLTN